MENLQFTSMQTIALAIVYAAYLAWVMFGGLRRRRIKLRVYIIMTLLMIYGAAHEFTGIHTAAELANIMIVLSVGFVKGIVLGKRKLTECVGGTWYMRHDGKYIILWAAFFGLKLLLTQALTIATGSQFPMWHMILYFCFYYPWRTVNVFRNNPEMRKAVLAAPR